ncbi:MAG: serine/threonine protein kinase [Betaproteobacteria bacterium]|nr:MAG: serine/threonine protein kinase [Betaproteobacteria bacterium]
MQLTPIQFSRLSRLINEALDKPESKRSEWLASIADIDAAERSVVERVFSEASGGSAEFTLALPDFPSAMESGNHRATERASSLDVAAGERFGPWRLDRLLGSGGMGQVWLALRDDGRFDGRAAVKLVRGFASETTRRRFDVEGKLLARLEHPNIARLIDAGERNGGAAYLILEYVDGLPIDRWADERRLSVQERLKLFLQICTALSYAHANLIVHRDIKPSNILVQDDGQVKLLDFGVAKLLEDNASSELTMEVGAALTPSYASPEQIDGRPIGVSTDVYSLGVLLFALLAGASPYDVTRLTRLQLVRAVLEVPPLRLSTASRTRANGTLSSTDSDAADTGVLDAGDEATLQRVARLRSTTPERLQRALRGDLDVILAQSLKKLPSERYASVQAFADDIERYLNHQPIRARADSVTYRAAKFVRRNWIAVTAAAAVGMATAGGVTATLWQAQQVKAEAARANTITEFLIGVFSANDTRIANEKPRGQMTARELLDVSAERIERDFADYPDTQHDLLGYFAEIYGGLSEDKRYDELRERQRVLIAKHYPPLSVPAIEWSLQRANRVCGVAVPVGCDVALHLADELIRRAGKDDSALRADWLRHKARFVQGQPNGSTQREAALRGAIALLEKHEPRGRRLVTAIADLGIAYSDELEYPKAIAQYRRALQLGQSLPSQNVNEAATIYSNLGLAHSSSSQFDEAIDVLQTASALMTKTGGATDPTHWSLLQQLAQVYQRTGQREKAMQVFAELLPNLPPAATAHREADRARNAYADALIYEGRASEAIPILEEIERHYLANVQYEFLLRSLRWSMGWAYQAVGRFDDANRSLKLALDEAVAREKPESQMVLALRESYGNLLFEMGDIDSAAKEFSEIVARANGRKLSHVALGHGGLARVAAARRDIAVALAESDTALSIWANKTGFSNGRMEPRLQRMRADALAAAGLIDEAQAMEDRAWQTSQRFDGPSNPTTQRRVMKLVSANKR